MVLLLQALVHAQQDRYKNRLREPSPCWSCNVHLPYVLWSSMHICKHVGPPLYIHPFPLWRVAGGSGFESIFLLTCKQIHSPSSFFYHTVGNDFVRGLDIKLHFFFIQSTITCAKKQHSISHSTDHDGTKVAAKWLHGLMDNSHLYWSLKHSDVPHMLWSYTSH